ncbi:hypothetical protein LCGC14_1311490 [marine sediment metagenome]|uniref:Uncharacterized protein n=1 Tax=marine sediment metagenome TaxID=412755 RepID=A0A0F9NPN4_9ZZZZ
MIKPFKAFNADLIIKWDKVCVVMFGKLSEKEMIPHTDPTIIKKNPGEKMATGRNIVYRIVKVLTEYGPLELTKEISEEYIKYLEDEVKIDCWTAEEEGEGTVITVQH